MINLLESRYRPAGSAIFQELDRKYQQLNLDSCDSVMQFAEKLRQARAELLEMDRTCQIGEPQFLNKFLCGLGPSYEVFLTAFTQNHNILPVRDPANSDIITKPAVTFETAIFAAEQEEQRQKGVTVRLAQVAAMIAQESSGCGHCGRKGHDKPSCWKLHPELTKEHGKKFLERRQRKVQRREKEGEKEANKDSELNSTALAYLQPQ